MSALPSFRRRLTVSVLLASLVAAVAVAAAVSWVVRHEVQEIMDDTLIEAAEVLHNTLAWARPIVATTGAVSGALPSSKHEEHMVWQLLDATGQVVLHSHRAPSQALVPSMRQGFADVERRWRVHARPLAFEPGTLLVAQPAGEREEAIREATQYAAGAAFLLGLLSAAWLSLTVRRELQPLERLSRAVELYDPITADGTLGRAERAELAPMHAAIEGLGRRLGQRVRHERAFAAHAAHALRTPLAGLVTQLKVAERHSTPAGQGALAQARSAADRLRRVVSALLALFRSGHELQLSTVDLATLVRELPSGGVTVEVKSSPPFRADADLLAAALANLLDNAVRHGARKVSVQALGDAQAVCIVVQDDGPGIAPPQLQALQASLDDPDEDAVGGLGLKMADWVARAHGGRLRVAPSTSGCRIELTLRVG